MLKSMKRCIFILLLLPLFVQAQEPGGVVEFYLLSPARDTITSHDSSYSIRVTYTRPVWNEALHRYELLSAGTEDFELNQRFHHRVIQYAGTPYVPLRDQYYILIMHNETNEQMCLSIRMGGFRVSEIWTYVRLGAIPFISGSFQLLPDDFAAERDEHGDWNLAVPLTDSQGPLYRK